MQMVCLSTKVLIWRIAQLIFVYPAGGGFAQRRLWAWVGYPLSNTTQWMDFWCGLKADWNASWNINAQITGSQQISWIIWADNSAIVISCDALIVKDILQMNNNLGNLVTTAEREKKNERSQTNVTFCHIVLLVILSIHRTFADAYQTE